MPRRTICRPYETFTRSCWATTSEGLTLAFDLALEGNWLFEEGYLDEEAKARDILRLVEEAAQKAIASKSLAIFRKAPGDVCEEVVAEMKEELDYHSFRLLDVAIKNAVMHDPDNQPVSGSASTAARAREDAARQEAKIVKTIAHGTAGRIRVGKALTFKMK